MSPSVYLLAAGNGTRAGGPKAWRPYQGKGLLQRQMDFLLARFGPDDIAVSIQQAWLNRCREIHPLVRWTCVAPGLSPLGALLELLAAMPLTRWGFLYHVDMPVWEPGLFDILENELGRAEREGSHALIPTHQGRKGHPIALAARMRAELTALDPVNDRLDWWLRSRKVVTVEVPNPCINENLNR